MRIKSMDEGKPVRIDKFLWSVRIYKTRSIATGECRKGRILINDVPVKPSRLVGRNEIMVVRKPPVVFTFRVIEPIENRVSAKLVPGFLEDLTPEAEKMKLNMKNAGFRSFREKGTGRPTKKERRSLDQFFEGMD